MSTTDSVRYFLRLGGNQQGGAMSVVAGSAREALETARRMIADGREVIITDSASNAYDLHGLEVAAADDDNTRG